MEKKKSSNVERKDTLAKNTTKPVESTGSASGVSRLVHSAPKRGTINLSTVRSAVKSIVKSREK